MTNGEMPFTEEPFPPDFVWGAATASYQIEGAVNEGGRGESIWDRFSHTPGKVLNGDTGDVATDHYHRWRDDIRLMRQLGLNAYRFSVAWPRVIPEGRGRVNQQGLDFYDRLVEGLLEAGIIPWITLYHWDLPQPLENQGGWTNRDTVGAFEQYVEAVTQRLGDRVTHWITLNEPWVSAFLGYGIGEHAPGRKDYGEFLQAAHTLLMAHGRAVEVVRDNVRDAQVGITLNLSQAYPATESSADEAATRRYDGFFNRWFLDPLYGRGYPEDILELYGDLAPETQPEDFELISAHTNFLGVNYYSPAFVKDDPSSQPLRASTVNPPGEYTEMQWLVYPRGLYDLMLRLNRDYPVQALYVTENGAAYPDKKTQEGEVHDPERVRYYMQHLSALRHAIADGAPVRGYFAWSLMDNFEWAFGYSKRFGISYVDYETLERTVKDSGLYYSRVIKENRVLPTEAVTS